MKKFWFDGQCSADFGLMASGSGTYNAPERDVETITVPGRNGDLIQDNGRFKNITVSYPVSICEGLEENTRSAREWLLSKSGYKRLEDEYHPDTFRMAMFKGPLDFFVSPQLRAAEATLTFVCKPQRYLKSGDKPINISLENVVPDSDGYELIAARLRNPTAFPALPVIKISGSGAVDFLLGSAEVKIHELDGVITLDCETLNAYHILPYESRNHLVTASEFPVFLPGDNLFGIRVRSGSVYRIEITPRWWTL